MFGLFKKTKDKDKQISSSTAVIKNQVAKEMSEYTNNTFKKPDYNPQTRKTYYDKGSAHKTAKNIAFSGDKPPVDPYTQKVLVQTKSEAKQKYGEHWQEHLAEADHIEPLNHVAKRAQKNPWLTTDDVREIANDQENYQLISRKTNQTGGKGGSTQTEWSKDYDKMKELSRQSNESVESLANRIQQTGEAAEKRNTASMAKASVKNATSTAHKAGTYGAAYSGATAATISSVYNISACVSGEKTASEALQDIGTDAKNAAVSGYKYNASTTLINNTLSSSNSQFLSALGDANVAGKTITAVSIVGDTVVKWSNGDITTEECLIELGDKGTNFAGASVGAAIGGMLPIPFIGPIIGSMIGGTLTSCIYNSIIEEYQTAKEEELRKEQEIYLAMMRYYAEQQRRKDVHELIQVNTAAAVFHSLENIMAERPFQALVYEAASYFSNYRASQERIATLILVTLQLKEYRQQLQKYIDQYFAKYEYCFESAIQLMDSSLKVGDFDRAIDATNYITKLFGKKPIIENTEDFRKKIWGNDKISF